MTSDDRVKRQAEYALRYAPDIDTAYEEDLKACREKGHESIEVCGRCGEQLGTMEAE